MTVSTINASSAVQHPGAPAHAAPPSVDAEASLMADPMLDAMAGEDMFEKIAALLTQSTRQDRKHARESAHLEERNIMAEGRKRIKAMRKEADAIRKEAWVRGGTQVASAAMSFEGTAQLGRDPHATTVHVTSEQYADYLKASAAGTSGIGEIVAGGYKGDQTDLKADAVEHESLSEAAKRRQQQHQSEVDDAQRMLNKIADFLQDIQKAQNEAAKAAILRA